MIAHAKMFVAFVFSALLFPLFLFPSFARAKSVQDFEALAAADQSAYLSNFVDKMAADLGRQNPETAQQIHTFFYAKQPGKPMSEGLEKIGIELVALDTMAKQGRADLSKVQIEQIIVFVTKQRFKPQQQ